MNVINLCRFPKSTQSAPLFRSTLDAFFRTIIKTARRVLQCEYDWLADPNCVFPMLFELQLLAIHKFVIDHTHDPSSHWLLFLQKYKIIECYLYNTANIIVYNNWFKLNALQFWYALLNYTFKLVKINWFYIIGNRYLLYNTFCVCPKSKSFFMEQICQENITERIFANETFQSLQDWKNTRFCTHGKKI